MSLYTAPLLIYCVISAIFFGVGVLNHITTVIFGTGADPISVIWVLNWWHYCLTHWIDPFFTNVVWYPYNYHLVQQVMAIGNFFLVSPIVAFFGPVVAYNLTEIFMSAIVGWAAFLLCHHATKSFWPALFGGYFFGFSSYMIGHSLGHTLYITLFPLPLIVLLCVKMYNRAIAPRRFVIFAALLLSLQFYICLEVFATATVFGCLALFLVLVIYKDFDSFKYLLKYLSLSGLVALVLVTPYLYGFFSQPLPQNGYPAAFFYSNDLLNLIVPGPLKLISNSFTLHIYSHFTGNVSEQNGYIGLPLLFLLVLFAKEFWRERLGKLLILFIIITFITSLGPFLHIDGKAYISMPWRLISHIPLLKHALPGRFALFMSLALSVAMAYWLTNSKKNIYYKTAILSLSLLFMLPIFNYKTRGWAQPLLAPKFITNKMYRKWLKPGDVVVILPYSTEGNSMYWQMRSEMYFKMAGGYLGYTPLSFANQPIVQAFFKYSHVKNINLGKNKKLINSLKLFLFNHNISAIMVGSNFATWQNLFKTIGLTPIHTGDIDLYRIKPITKELKQYANYKHDLLNYQNGNTATFLVSDLNSQVGFIKNHARVATNNVTKSGFLTFGPYIHLSKGSYLITLKYKTNKLGSPSTSSWFDVSYNQGTMEAYSTHLTDTNNSVKDLSMNITIPDNKNNRYEFRVFYTGHGDLTVYNIKLKKVS